MKSKEDFRKEVAEQFLSSLKDEKLNWHKEWHSNQAPYNAFSKAHYKGINAFYLMLVSLSLGYADPRWLTFKQATKLHVHIKANEHGRSVEYWMALDHRKEAKKRVISFPEAKKLIREGKAKGEDFSPVAKYYTVFNACQVEGLPELPKTEPVEPINTSELVVNLSENMGVPIDENGGDMSFYVPDEDCIHLPKKECFKSQFAYDSVALHELAHSTGNAKRLNRNIKNMFGTEDYAFEELIAEMTSAFMAVETVAPEQLEDDGLKKYTENHKAYIQSWSDAIHKKPDFLVKAVKEAEKAADYMDMKAGLLSEEEYQKKHNNHRDDEEEEKAEA
jgi:antirestriction protein ArdC